MALSLGGEAPKKEAENQRRAGDEPPSAKSGLVSSSASWQIIPLKRGWRGWEMTLWGRALALQAWGPEFEFLAPMSKLSMAVYVGWRQEDPESKQPSWNSPTVKLWVSKSVRPCLTVIRQRAIEEDPRCSALAPHARYKHTSTCGYGHRKLAIPGEGIGALLFAKPQENVISEGKPTQSKSHLTESSLSSFFAFWQTMN